MGVGSTQPWQRATDAGERQASSL